MDEEIISRSFYFLFNERIDVRLHLRESLCGSFQIVGKNIYYSYDMLMNWWGLQCKYNGGTPEYETVHYKCQRIRDLFLEKNKITVVDGLVSENSRTILQY